MGGRGESGSQDFTKGLFVLGAAAARPPAPGPTPPSSPRLGLALSSAGVFIFCWFIVLYFPSQSTVSSSSGTARAEQTHTASSQ